MDFQTTSSFRASRPTCAEPNDLYLRDCDRDGCSALRKHARGVEPRVAASDNRDIRPLRPVDRDRQVVRPRESTAPKGLRTEHVTDPRRCRAGPPPLIRPRAGCRASFRSRVIRIRSQGTVSGTSSLRSWASFPVVGKNSTTSITTSRYKIEFMTRFEARFGSRELFPNLESRAYLNHAAMSPLSLAVCEAMRACMDDYGRRGLGAFFSWHEQRKRLKDKLATYLDSSINTFLKKHLSHKKSGP